MMQRRAILAASLGFLMMGNSSADACGWRWRPLRRRRVLPPCCVGNAAPEIVTVSVIYYYTCPNDTTGDVYVQAVDAADCESGITQAIGQADTHCECPSSCFGVSCNGIGQDCPSLSTQARLTKVPGYYCSQRFSFSDGFKFTIVGFGRDLTASQNDLRKTLRKVERKFGRATPVENSPRCAERTAMP